MVHVYISSLIGKREENQDSHVCIMNLNNEDTTKYNMQILDGHGDDGLFVSSYLAKNMHNVFMDKNLKHPLTNSNIIKIYEQFNLLLKEKYFDKCKESGSTCLTVLQYDNIFKIINTGDSRAIICNKDNIAVQLSLDHKANSPLEYNRIKKLGGEKEIKWDGFDYRIKDLSLSKSFCDFDNKYISCIPDIYDYKLNNDKFLILTCDGVYYKNLLVNQNIIDFILSKYFNLDTNQLLNINDNIAEGLAKHAINDNKSDDNVSIIVIVF